MCTTLIYILTWFKSTPLSAIIIAHLLKGSAQFLLHLRRAAAGRSPSAPSKHSSGAASYPNSFSTHLKPLHSNGVTLRWKGAGSASAMQQRLDGIFPGSLWVDGWRATSQLCLTVVVDHTRAQLDSYANKYTESRHKQRCTVTHKRPQRCVYALRLEGVSCECKQNWFQNAARVFLQSYHINDWWI